MNFEYTSALAEELDITESTLRGWIKTFGIKSFKNDGKRCFSPEMADVLRQIKALKDDGLQTPDIALTIKPFLAEARDGDVVIEGNTPNLQEFAAAFEQQVTAMLTKHSQDLRKEFFGDMLVDRDNLVKALAKAEAENEQVQKLLPEKTESLSAAEEQIKSFQDEVLRNCERIAKLEVEAEAAQKREQELLAELEKERKQILALSDKASKAESALNDFKAELKASQSQLDTERAKNGELEAEIKALREQLNIEKGKSGWAKLLGK